MQINCNQAIQVIARFNDYIQEHELALNEWDKAADHDHGSHMSHAMRKVMQSLDRQDYTSPQEVFQKTSSIFATEGEGAACQYYACAFLGMAQAKSPLCLSDALESALEALEKESDAVYLDKTMLDVWRGVLELYETDRFQVELIQAIPQRTKEMVARRGKAAENPTASQYILDPGSMSSMYLMLAFHDVLF